MYKITQSKDFVNKQGARINFICHFLLEENDIKVPFSTMNKKQEIYYQVYCGKNTEESDIVTFMREFNCNHHYNPYNNPHPYNNPNPYNKSISIKMNFTNSNKIDLAENKNVIYLTQLGFAITSIVCIYQNDYLITFSLDSSNEVKRYPKYISISRCIELNLVSGVKDFSYVIDGFYYSYILADVLFEIVEDQGEVEGQVEGAGEIENAGEDLDQVEGH